MQTGVAMQGRNHDARAGASDEELLELATARRLILAELLDQLEPV